MEADDLHMMDGEGEEIDVDGNISDDSDVGLTEIKAQDFHFMLSVILESHMDLQQTTASCYGPSCTGKKPTPCIYSSSSLCADATPRKRMRCVANAN